ncbi:hypothetical protein RchiOBHm_Chr3g0450191 [Rosa chinensis]|uniref:Uncharacterized protein n=1 Tax=Rosa chinensis TaxID=74649 RepID=A0A2P6R5P5_ROSCH|nr:hypothetical protein RchiOBHm_Chr3g0450171 [Rosa chinensis]PRQ41753.1 hypothetical protein RchiOBHm_Chr3g0450191 [Rosa chinensis]
MIGTPLFLFLQLLMKDCERNHKVPAAHLLFCHETCFLLFFSATCLLFSFLSLRQHVSFFFFFYLKSNL